jgi:hypothetical protein
MFLYTYLNVHNDQRKQIYSMSKASILGLALLALSMAYLLQSQLEEKILYLGVLLHLVVLIFRSYIIYLYKKIPYSSNYRWMVLFTFGAFLSGLVWSLSAVYIYKFISIEHQFLIYAITIGIAGVGMASLSAVLVTYLAFLVPLTFPLILWLLLQEQEVYYVGAVLYSIGIVYYIVTAYRMFYNQKK